MPRAGGIEILKLVSKSSRQRDCENKLVYVDRLNAQRWVEQLQTATT